MLFDEIRSWLVSISSLDTQKSIVIGGLQNELKFSFDFPIIPLKIFNYLFIRSRYLQSSYYDNY